MPLVAVMCLMIGLLTVAPTPALAAVIPTENPPIEKACGIDVSLVLDASGSVNSSHAVGSVRTAAAEFLDALEDTGSTARVIQFASIAEQLASRELVTAQTLTSSGPLGAAVEDYYNPIPPRPSGVDIKSYRGSGSIYSANSWSSANSSNQYTNWNQALDVTATDPGDLVVFITDGDPTSYDFDQPNDPFAAGPPADVAVNTDRNSEAATSTLDRAVESANAVKAQGARMLALGVGVALQNNSSVNRLVQVSGPDVARSFSEFDIETTDVALVSDFDDLASAVRGLVLELCSPSLTIRKYAQTADDATYAPAPGWDVTVTPTVGAGSFGWVLPTGAAGPSWTLSTDSNGFAQFQWEPDPAEATSTALVQESLQAGFDAGRPAADDYRCELKDADGNTRVVAGELTGAGDPSFSLDPIGQEIVTCSLWNSFDYAPAIGLAKVNQPTEVRGDLSPPAVVTSSYTATNPGNTPLNNVAVTDDQCGPVLPVPATGANTGDTDTDGLLDPGESWEFTCDRVTQTSQGPPGGINVVNIAVARGIDPAGTAVTATASDDVDVFNPGIALTKLVNDEPAVTVVSGTQVTYTYAAANTGNTPLSPVVLVDDTAPCQAPTRGADTPGNDDATMDVGETWTYSCTANPTAPVVNTAIVTATPLNPNDGNQPFVGNNPDVTATGAARVTTTDPGLVLTKDVDQQVVFPGTAVTYTYTATNTGDTDLRNDTGDAGWVTDDTCDPVQQVQTAGFNTGDTNTDTLLNPEETWQFSCTTTIDDATVNLAEINAQPVDDVGQPSGDPLVRNAIAIVLIVEPAISLTKVPLVPVVLDPDATPFAGPDVPTPRPAEYTYAVANAGTVPIAEVVVTDDRCDAVTYVDGDTDSNSTLDVSEVWNYDCVTALERQGGSPAPTGAESGLVTNTATVTGTPFLPTDPSQTGEPVTATDTAQVLVIQPALTLTKSASASVIRANDEVTYTVAVSNTGDVGLDILGPADDECAALMLTGGDTNSNGLLDGANSAAAETWTYTCTRAVGMPPPPNAVDTNVAAVIAVDPLGNLYLAGDTAEVRVIDPAIRLTKTVSSPLVPSGTEVTYLFDVDNVGSSPVAVDDALASVTLVDVADPATPTCDNPSLVAKNGGNNDDLLDRDPAELWVYACTATITEPTTNVGVVGALGGTAFDLELVVLDAAAAFVQPFTPGIDVTKTADPSSLTGTGQVSYTYLVRNTGDVPLAGVADRISDDTCSPITYVSGDQDADGLLDTPISLFEDSLDETWTFTCVTTVATTTTNVVTVPGTPTDPDGEPLCGPTELDRNQVSAPCDVTGQATATVQVTLPATTASSTPAPTYPASSYPAGSSGGGTLSSTGSGIGWPVILAGMALIALGGVLLVSGRSRGLRTPPPS